MTGLTPIKTTLSPSISLTGLNNAVTYYVAVTAVNKTGSEDKVAPSLATVTPEADTTGPTFTMLKVNGQTLADNLTLAVNSTFTAQATDPAGISRITFNINGKTHIDSKGIDYTLFLGYHEYQRRRLYPDRHCLRQT